MDFPEPQTYCKYIACKKRILTVSFTVCHTGHVFLFGLYYIKTTSGESLTFLYFNSSGSGMF